MQTNTPIPNAKDFTPAPLRHRLQLQLNAPVADVWELVGQHTRMPEYSSGIASVEIERGPDGSRARVCQFRSPDGTGLGPRLRERVRWEVPNLGYATTTDPGNAFGLENCLELLTVAAVPAGTLLTW